MQWHHGPAWAGGGGEPKAAVLDGGGSSAESETGIRQVLGAHLQPVHVGIRHPDRIKIGKARTLGQPVRGVVRIRTVGGEDHPVPAWTSQLASIDRQRPGEPRSSNCFLETSWRCGSSAVMTGMTNTASSPTGSQKRLRMNQGLDGLLRDGAAVGVVIAAICSR